MTAVTVVSAKVDTDEGRKERRPVLQETSPCKIPFSYQPENYQAVGLLTIKSNRGGLGRGRGAPPP